jgi:hypothetical protein
MSADISRTPDLNPDGICTGGPPISTGTSTPRLVQAWRTSSYSAGPPFLSGTRFDVQFELVSDGSIPTRPTPRQRGLLSQVQHLHRRWWPTMIMLKLCRQLTASGSRCWPAGPTSEGSRRDRRRRSQLWKAWRRDRPFPAESAESLAPADSAGSTAWMDANRFDTSLEIGMDVTRFDTSLEIGKFRSAW